MLDWDGVHLSSLLFNLCMDGVVGEVNAMVFEKFGKSATKGQS